MAETRVALVTGANRGIGLEIVRGLARLGIVAVIGARDRAKGLAAAETFEREGLVTPVVELDVTDEASIRAAVAEAMGPFGRIDILVNNAGILLDGPQGRVAALEGAAYTTTFATNVTGPANLIRTVLPLMREQGYGRIVNVSSTLGQLSEMGNGWPAYRMSKTALNALTRTTAAELGDVDIKVNSLCPGWVKTDMGGPEAPRTPAEGADTAVWLATLPASGPTGGFFRDRKPIAW
ncbi:MAG: SDR family oxidoreductase [Hyphomicrobiaceae bacterium]|nr:SDR family oxidoreductase [Hyphomicrobiaceae bacterium]